MTWTEVPGFFTPFDAMDYEHLVNSLPDNSTMAEIGCHRGKSLASIAPTLIRKNIKVHAIDIFDKVEVPGYLEPGVTSGKQGMFDDFLSTIKQFKIDNLVTVHAAPSLEVAERLSDLDFVFIDGDHSYEMVKAELEAWWPKVKVGGVLSGHDYDHNGRGWPGVHKAVHEKFGQPYFGVYIWSVRKTINGWETQSFLK